MSYNRAVVQFTFNYIIESRFNIKNPTFLVISEQENCFFCCQKLLKTDQDYLENDFYSTLELL